MKKHEPPKHPAPEHHGHKPHVRPAPVPHEDLPLSRLDWAGIAMLVALAAAIVAGLFLSWPAKAAECPMERQESRITEKIVAGEDRVFIFTGDGAQTLFSGLQSLGLFVGVLPNQFDKIYVIPYKYIYHIFFVNSGCIVDARDALQSVAGKVMP